MNENGMKKRAPLLLGVVWFVAVSASYYVANAGYYKEKISVFGKFLLGMLS